MLNISQKKVIINLLLLFLVKGKRIFYEKYKVGISYKNLVVFSNLTEKASIYNELIPGSDKI